MGIEQANHIEHFRVVDMAPHVLEAVESKSRSARHNLFMREKIRDVFRRKTNTVIFLEFRPVGTADEPV
jgi:hypothetical protein